MFEDYESTRGGEPHKDVEPTSDQIAAVKQLIGEDVPPYVDFAIFGPYGRRILRKITFVAWAMASGGEWVKREIPGPPDFGTWWKSWRLLKTTFLLLGIATTEVLDNYGEFIRGLHDRYGPQCWFLICLGDARMRSEEFERIRRRCEKVHARDTEAGRDSVFRPAMPWDAVFREATIDRDFWDEEVKDKAVLFLAQVKGSRELSSDDTLYIQDDEPQQRTPGRKRPWQPAGGTQPSPVKSAKMHSWELPDLSQKDASGVYTHNRRGNELCQKYNAGDCHGNQNTCPNGFKHQCNKCLGPHTAKSGSCGKGNGKGKGKSKGKRA